MRYRPIFYLFILATLSLGCKQGSSTVPQTIEGSPTPQAGDLPSNIVQYMGNDRVTTFDTACPDVVFAPVTDFKVRQTPNLPEPIPRKPYQDPVFGNCVVRVTDRHHDLSSVDTSRGLKNEYSRVQAFNSDGRLILLRGTEATWYIYDSSALRPLVKLPFDGAVDPRWSSQDPMVIHYFDETRLMAFDLKADTTTLIHDFSKDFPNADLASVSTRHEGSPSQDGRYWGLMAQNKDWEAVALMVYDQQLNTIVAKRDISGSPELDSVTISPLGNYLLAYFDYCETGLGNDGNLCGLMVFDRELKNGRGMLRIVGHSDLVLDSDKREGLIYQDIDTDHISYLSLLDGDITALWPIDFSQSPIGFHFSGQAFEKPGWALVSTYNGARPQNATWMDDQLFAIEIKPSGRVIRLAHTHSLVAGQDQHDYWAEPQATVDRNFTRILYTTNWGRAGTEQVETFLLLLPQNWQEQLP